MDTKADPFWININKYISGEANELKDADKFIYNKIDLITTIIDAIYDKKEIDPNK